MHDRSPRDHRKPEANSKVPGRREGGGCLRYVLESLWAFGWTFAVTFLVAAFFRFLLFP
ncbi:MAG: hypothetical protein HY875_08005 [Chloroflexi bacterium]|nr:hypothetical protein [Chloroflexota bacterium]